MGQRGRTLTQILGYRGWRVTETWFERGDGTRVTPVAGYDVPRELLLVFAVERRWAARCSSCGAICSKRHAQLEARRWRDEPWASRPVVIQYAPIRVSCRKCGGQPVEMLAWADPHQRQTRRLQQHLAIEAFSMPLSHVAALHELDWSTVRRAERCAIERWEQTQPPAMLRHVGVDEKYLGRRHRREAKFVTIVSNVETGEPLWIGFGRDEATLASWLATQTAERKTLMELFVMDMFKGYWNAVDHDPDLKHVAIVHDPFHVMKRAVEAMDELRREVFFRGGAGMRAIGRGKRWLVLRAWESTTPGQKEELRHLFRLNGRLARGYQIVEDLRAALHAPDRDSMETALSRIARRTQLRSNVPMRKLHNSLLMHWNDILSLGEHRPAAGRVEALNNNWEALIRRNRGSRDLDYLRRKLRFMIANPIRTDDGLRRFRALDLPAPMPQAA